MKIFYEPLKSNKLLDKKQLVNMKLGFHFVFLKLINFPKLKQLVFGGVGDLIELNKRYLFVCLFMFVNTNFNKIDSLLGALIFEAKKSGIRFKINNR